MTHNPKRVALLAYLRETNDVYFGKLLELREAVLEWLAYIPATFPHYTRHTVQHSDEIVAQASSILFADDDFTKPAVRLSATEAYILCAGAYLHDAGMVTSDQEKAEIISSDAWRAWTTGSAGGADRWKRISELRTSTQVPSESTRNFLADTQTRFLIAEFVRTKHHLRAADVVTQHQGALGRFAFDDLVLQQTISDVCVSHGLRANELEDQERFPERRTIRGDEVNVRFVAVLLRLSDLLDMSSDRACPLLLNAACPVPKESLAHWTQYRRIEHRLTAPDRIEIRARCNTQDEHRVLQDWCQWIVNEVRSASVLMARSKRHGGWKPPDARLEGPEPTIRVLPSNQAQYVPTNWQFELDRDAVFQRLVNNVNSNGEMFLRELVQNALDSMRCRLYFELGVGGKEAPEFPYLVDPARRESLPLHISIKEVKRKNALSGETEVRHLLSVDDSGIGMDREIIQRYLLQVGRSYYVSDEFRRKYRFTPTSQFGVGFLSVFSASEAVEVESFKPSSETGDGAIKLSLSGPRNYLLTEKSQRRASGTRVDVLLTDSWSPGRLTTLLRGWCRFVEFPILVDDFGVLESIVAETDAEHVYSSPAVTKKGMEFVVRSFPVDRSGLQGFLYVFACISEAGESWTDWNWSQRRYPDSHPSAVPPVLPPSITCLNGIAYGGQSHDYEGSRTRIDVRKQFPETNMSRQRHYGPGWLPGGVAERWQEIVSRHIATTKLARLPDGWKYIQKLVSSFSVVTNWRDLPEAVRVCRSGVWGCVSLAEVDAARDIWTLGVPGIARVWNYLRQVPELVTVSDSLGAVAIPDVSLLLVDQDVQHLSELYRLQLFGSRSIKSIELLGSTHLCIRWVVGPPAVPELRDGEKVCSFAKIPRCSWLVGVSVHQTTSHTYGHSVLNTGNPFVQWLLRVRAACGARKHGLSPEQFERLASLVAEPVRSAGHDIEKLNGFLVAWGKLPRLPKSLRPVDWGLKRSSFELAGPDAWMSLLKRLPAVQ